MNKKEVLFAICFFLIGGVLGLASISYLTRPEFTSTEVSSCYFDKKLHEECIYPTVIVSETTTDQYGSGVIVKSEPMPDGKFKNIVLTCAHVFSGANIQKFSIINLVYDKSEVIGLETYKCIPYAGNAEFDLAVVLFVSDHKMYTAVLDFDSKPFIGNDIVKIGCGGKNLPRMDLGKISSVEMMGNLGPHKLYRTTAFTVPGDSGGPLFLNYKLIGIINSVNQIPRQDKMEFLYHMSYAIPINDIKEWDKILNSNIDFTYDLSQATPIIPLIFKEFEYYIPSVKIGPDHFWENK